MYREELPETYAALTSPERRRLIGYVAGELGHSDLAERFIAEAESELRQITEKVCSVRRGRKVTTT